MDSPGVRKSKSCFVQFVLPPDWRIVLISKPRCFYFLNLDFKPLLTIVSCNRRICQIHDCFGFKYLSVLERSYLVQLTKKRNQENQKAGLIVFESMSLVPLHQTSSIKHGKVFESKNNKYVTQVWLQEAEDGRTLISCFCIKSMPSRWITELNHTNSVVQNLRPRVKMLLFCILF